MNDLPTLDLTQLPRVDTIDNRFAVILDQKDSLISLGQYHVRELRAERDTARQQLQQVEKVKLIIVYSTSATLR